MTEQSERLDYRETVTFECTCGAFIQVAGRESKTKCGRCGRTWHGSSIHVIREKESVGANE